ncbi:S10 family peptidase [Geotalea toluenoxydans]|uniref:S10 family peptidase n=1 Tax=Geotalea toluenoxydans TaxID=421624 RepID=UPI000AD66B76|nr:peptidase S10 [Geotalea toluenoxydans]
MFRFFILVAALLISIPYPAGAHQEPAAAAEAPPREMKQVEEKPVVSSHRLSIGKKELSYQVTAGHLPVISDSGETEARIFFIAYTLENRQPENRRPLLFVFNGGPGSSSVWLHLGTIGPKRVQMLPDGTMPPPPYRLTDNEYTWLEQADLVFIDPVGTGYSRAAKPDLAKKFSSVQGDIEAVGKFIRLYLGRYGRWNSPLFLVGESYGAFRAAGLADYLLEHGIAMNGTILISAIMNMQTVSFDPGNDLPYALYLPSYTATAWYHGKLATQAADPDKILQEAEAWAENEYLTALAKGDRLSPDERKAIAGKLSQFTGLSPAFIEGRNLRIDSRTFVRELLRDRQLVTGTMDSRFLASNVDPSSPHGFDPTVATIRPPYTTLFNDYIRNEIGFRSDMEYFILGGGIGRWDWEAKNGYADTSEDLREAMAKNPYMKLFVAMGCFDLATPHFSTEYTLNHLGLTPALRNNLTIRRYRGGHMMYLDLAALSRLTKDVTAFIDDSSAAAP